MNIKMSKLRMVFFLIGLFMTNMAIMADFAVIPIVENLFTTFDNVPAINFFVSGPALVCVVAALVSGQLMQHFRKRTLLIIGFGLFTVGGVFGNAIESLPFMIFMRTLVGASMGIVNSVAMALITDVFEGKTRGRIIGFYTAAMAAVGALMGTVAGNLAVAMGWQAVFKVYYLAVPVLILLIFFAPSTPPDSKKVAEETSEADDGLWKKKLAALLASKTFYTLVYFIFNYHTSVFVAERALGTEAFSGLLASLGTIGSAIACLLFGFVYSKINRRSISAGYIVMTLCYVGLYFAPTPEVAAVLCFIMGGSFGTGFSYFFMQSTVILPANKASIGVSLVTACDGMGMFLSTYAATGLQILLGVNTINGIFPAVIGLLAAAAVISTTFSIKSFREDKVGRLNHSSQSSDLPDKE